MAKKLNISYCYLNLIETNKRKIGKKMIPKLAKALEESKKEIEYHNTTYLKNGYDEQKRLVQKQINVINKEIAKIVYASTPRKKILFALLFLRLAITK